MNTKLVWIVTQALRKVWVRVMGFALLALLTVTLAPLLPAGLTRGLDLRLGGVAVDQILSILASSMLAVTTFSLSIAVSAFSAAASTATPRATALLQQDTTTQNVLATFLGAFLFSLVGLIAVRSDFYDDSGQAVLFLACLVVVALVVLALLRWISHLMSFGRMADTLDRVERAATRSLQQRLQRPFLGGQPLAGKIPAKTLPLQAASTGYIQHIDISALHACATAIDAELYLAVLPGSFVHRATTLLWIDGKPADPEQHAALRQAFTVNQERTFEQDPRFGLIVLTEIASRALSPAVNDPGTAISVIGRLVRVLSDFNPCRDPVIECSRVYVPALCPGDLIEDAFRPIARDGAGLVEVQIRLHKALDALAGIAPQAFAQPVAALAHYALQQATAAGLDSAELKLSGPARDP